MTTRRVPYTADQTRYGHATDDPRTPTQAGIWGGLTERERRKLKRSA